MENYVLQLSPLQYSTRIINVACHNYCVLRPMPLQIKSLLGLGLKYCIKKSLPSNDWKRTLERLKQDVRRIRFFKLHPPEEDDNNNEIKKIPDGIQLEGMVQPPAILILNPEVEIKYMSSSTGAVHMIKEKAVRLGVTYWKELDN